MAQTIPTRADAARIDALEVRVSQLVDELGRTRLSLGALAAIIMRRRGDTLPPTVAAIVEPFL